MMSKILKDVKWAVVGVVAIVGLLGACGAGVAQAQPSRSGDAAILARYNKAKENRENDKKAPKEISVPKPRTDKVLLLQEQGRTAELELAALIEKFKASAEFKAIEARQKAVGEKLVAELTSALKLAGVDEKDFDKYQYNRETLKFTLKEAEPAKK